MDVGCRRSGGQAEKQVELKRKTMSADAEKGTFKLGKWGKG